MNELLGWYGYDKVELRDSDSLEIGEMPQHISVLKGIKVHRTVQHCQISCLYWKNTHSFFTLKVGTSPKQQNHVKEVLTDWLKNTG